MRLSGAFSALLLASALAACSSTVPASTTAAPAARVAEASASSAPDGPVTASMAQLGLGGERYAALGDPAAPLTLVEFSDYGCPFCRRYVGTTFPDIKADYVDTGKVYYVFKDFPIVQNHPQAQLAAQAAECAGDQGHYWDMHARLFATPQEWATSAEQARRTFAVYADELGIDADYLGHCLAEGRYEAEVAQDFADARRLGLTGTPAFLIDGKLMSGAQPTAVFRKVLDRALAAR